MQLTIAKSKIKKLLQSKWCLLGIYFVICMYYELMHRSYLVPSFEGRGLLYITLFCAVGALILFVITSVFSPRANRVLACTITGILSVIYFSQMLYHYIFYTYYSMFSVLNGGSAMQFWQETLFTAGRNWWPLTTTVIPFLFMIIIGRKLFNFDKITIKKAGAFGGAILALHIATVLTLPLFGKEEFSPWTSIITPPRPIILWMI